MTVRRRAARLATVCGLLGGLVALGASPALADDDSVRVRSASSFTAGGSAGGVNIEVRKRTEGCVLLRTALGLRLEGLRADQVSVQVNVGGRWFPTAVSGDGGSVATGRISPANPTLCKGKSITARYRVTFAAGAPNGRLTVTGEATNAIGRELGQGAVASRVTGGRASASPTPSKTPSPTPSVAETEAATVGDGPTLGALGDPSGASDTGAAAEESSFAGSPVMFFGIAMVVVGLLLIGLLFRRSRQDRTPDDDLVGRLPGNPGGTTYRSGGGSPAAPLRPGPVYGQQPPAGGVYGAVPPPRPAGGVYGARPDGAGSVPDATQPMPGPPPAARPVSTPPVAPGSPPVAPGSPPAVPGSAATPPGNPPTGAGGDHTEYMPRLPG